MLNKLEKIQDRYLVLSLGSGFLGIIFLCIVFFVWLAKQLGVDNVIRVGKILIQSMAVIMIFSFFMFSKIEKKYKKKKR